jgi:hypothetical protein
MGRNGVRQGRLRNIHRCWKELGRQVVGGLF